MELIDQQSAPGGYAACVFVRLHAGQTQDRAPSMGHSCLQASALWPLRFCRSDGEPSLWRVRRCAELGHSDGDIETV